MKLHPTTFGDSPAAMYLTVLLNERGDAALARKVGKILSNQRETLNDLVESHFADTLSIRTLNRQLNLLSKFNQTEATSAIAKIDPFIAGLVVNVLEGGIKLWKVRASAAAIKQRSTSKSVPSGTSAPRAYAYGIAGEKTDETAKSRSRAYLARKQKINTLY